MYFQTEGGINLKARESPQGVLILMICSVFLEEIKYH